MSFMLRAKVARVIQSCTTIEQLAVAKSYATLAIIQDNNSLAALLYYSQLVARQLDTMTRS